MCGVQKERRWDEPSYPVSAVSEFVVAWPTMSTKNCKQRCCEMRTRLIEIREVNIHLVDGLR